MKHEAWMLYTGSSSVGLTKSWAAVKQVDQNIGIKQIRAGGQKQ